MEETVSFTLYRFVALGLIGLVLIGVVFAAIYWLLGRGRDDDSAA